MIQKSLLISIELYFNCHLIILRFFGICDKYLQGTRKFHSAESMSSHGYFEDCEWFSWPSKETKVFKTLLTLSYEPFLFTHFYITVHFKNYSK